MKKRMRRVLSALLTFTMVFSLANFTVAAGDDDPTVVYNVATEKFSFENVEVYEHTEEGAHEHPQNVDLFRDMKNAMPQEGVRMAIAFVVAVPIACIYPFFQKYFISGLTVGAVKG